MQYNNSMRSLKATLYSTYLDFKTTYQISVGIMIGLLIVEIIIFVFTKSGTVNSNATSLNSLFMIGLWASPISVIVITSQSELIKKFSFPVSRGILALSHLIYIFVSPLVLLLTACALYLVELLIFNVLQMVIPAFVYLLIATKESFVTGFFLSYAAIVLITSLAYFVFMYFHRYKVGTSIAGGIFITLFFFYEPFRAAIINIGKSLLYPSSPLLMCISYLGVSLAFIALAYIPLKRMEVKK